jgi:hypothetical protein
MPHEPGKSRRLARERPAPYRSANRLLTALSADERARLQPALEGVELPLKKVLAESDSSCGTRRRS